MSELPRKPKNGAAEPAKGAAGGPLVTHLVPDAPGVSYLTIRIPFKPVPDGMYGSRSAPYPGKMHVNVHLSETHRLTFAGVEAGVMAVAARMGNGQYADSRASVVRYLMELVEEALPAAMKNTVR